MNRQSTINFVPDLVPLILSGAKTLPYWIGNKYSFLEVGDEIDVADNSNNQVIARVKIIEKSYTTFKELPINRNGHEVYKTKQEQKETFKKYYGEVNDEDEILILGFHVIKET